MNRFKLLLAMMLGVIFSTGFSGLNAQDLDVLITPESAELEIGQGLQLEVFAYSINKDAHTPILADEMTWTVEPDSMGTITDDGFFIAGRKPGEVKIQVAVRLGGRVFTKRVLIRIGRILKPFFDVKVVPGRAVVPAGSEQAFHVVVSRGNLNVRPKFVRWAVEPDGLGKINDDGLFKAGDDNGHGKVIAHIEVDGLKLRAAAHVFVSQPAEGSIAGAITQDAQNLPIGGAVVRAVRLGRIPWIQKAESDDSGNYTIENLIPGVYVLHTRARGFIGEFYDDTRNYLEATPLNVQGDTSITDINFGLSEGGKIQGTVAVEPDTSAIEGAHVVAFLVVNPRFARHVITGDDGSYSVESLPSGSYAVVANASGYKREFYDDSPNFGGATFIDIIEPEAVPGIDFILSPASAISGTVTDEVDGSAIAGAHIKIYGSLATSLRDAKRILVETRSDDNGNYLVQLRPGSYIAYAAAQNYNGEFYDNVNERSQASPILVSPDSHSSDVDFSLVKRSSIAGSVKDQNTGEPIAGAIVEAFKERRNTNASLSDVGFRGKTDSLGNYLIENVPVGKYLVVANARHYLREFFEEASSKKEATFIEITEDTSVTDINFTLDAGGAIAGFVASAEDSMPLAKALVRVFDPNSGRHKAEYTDENGNYLVSGLPTGEYLVQVIARGYFNEFYENARHRGDATPVVVNSPDVTPNIDFYLEPHKDTGATIAGRVFSDTDDTPLHGAIVIAVKPNKRRPHITFTGPDGYYRLTDLPAGNYFVFSWALDFIGEFYDDAKLFRNADRVEVFPNQVKTGIDFGLTSLEGHGVYAIRGRIKSTSDKPLDGILVHATQDDEAQVNAVTDAEGNFVITGLAAGEYKIEATGAGYAEGYYGGSSAESAQAVAVGEGNDAENIEVSMEEDNITSVEGENGSALPGQFSLMANYPNPFNPETAIRYQLPESADISLKIFNLLGQEVRSLVSKVQEAGAYSVQWDGKDNFGLSVSSGIYFYQINAGNKFKMSKTMMLLK